MLAFLQSHPFAVEAFFEESLFLTFAIPKGQVQHLIPECLELDTFIDNWAFIAVAFVKTKDLRPKGFPKSMGNDFTLVGYRVFVKYVNNTGKRLRGLFILKSETDKRKMEWFGNIFTHYKYSTTDIKYKVSGQVKEISSSNSGFKILVDNLGNENIALPVNSPFSNWKEARKFAGPMPFTFSYDSSKKKVTIIEGVRENWKPLPVKVLNYKFRFLDEMQLPDIVLANAFVIQSIPYYWKKGKTELWKP
jgi:uncharacterized protein YqjF (DUF2071 family)